MAVAKRQKFEDEYTQLQALTVIVADTGDIDSIRKFRPTDATTNPSLLLKAAQMPQYAPFILDAIQYGINSQVSEDQRMELIMDRLAINFGKEITQIVPGYVSTELDARLSFDTAACIERGRRIIRMYEEVGVDRSRILVKIASTWEGIKAMEVLQQEGITCNMTLLFSMAQAIAAAQAGATLISPFVGRILDWYKAETGHDYEPSEDPGVVSVKQIYSYYKKFGHGTIVMGASFRNKGEILELAGIDRLTIAPNLLEELKNSNGIVEQKLSSQTAALAYEGEEVTMDENTFRLMMMEDAMANAKLAEGIRGFAKAAEELEEIIKTRIVATTNGGHRDQMSQLQEMTTLVADTGEINLITKLKPTDATTNPSLLYKAAGLTEYKHLVNDALEFGRGLVSVSDKERMDMIVDRLSVNFGREILQHVPGYVSTEVDARLSFDTEGTIARARRIIRMYQDAGVDKSRILIKIASTWEGIRAAEVLQREAVTCNMTLLFNLAQAVAAAEAGATLISPFVGRILDWHKKANKRDSYPADEDPGVVSVRQIYHYYKKFGYPTIVMGASFRNKEEILALAGCDRLTIAPKLLEELQTSFQPVTRVLHPSKSASAYQGERLHIDEKTFRKMLNDDPMATDKLMEGIRGFAADLRSLEKILVARL